MRLLCESGIVPISFKIFSSNYLTNFIPGNKKSSLLMFAFQCADSAVMRHTVFSCSFGRPAEAGFWRLLILPTGRKLEWLVLKMRVFSFYMPLQRIWPHAFMCWDDTSSDCGHRTSTSPSHFQVAGIILPCFWFCFQFGYIWSIQCKEDEDREGVEYLSISFTAKLVDYSEGTKSSHYTAKKACLCGLLRSCKVNPQHLPQGVELSYMYQYCWICSKTNKMNSSETEWFRFFFKSQ